MSTYRKRMINTIQSSGTKEAYRLAWEDSDRRKKARKAAKAARKKNR